MIGGRFQGTLGELRGELNTIVDLTSKTNHSSFGPSGSRCESFNISNIFGDQCAVMREGQGRESSHV